MSRITSFQVTSLVALASLTAFAAPPAHAITDKGEIAPWVARAEKAGPVENSKVVRIAVYLSFKNEKALDNLLEAQSTPGSAEYGRYLTPAQFHARFAPDKAEVSALRTTLQKQGLTIGHIPESGFYIEASGTVAQIKSAFHVDQNYYRFQGNVMRANTLAPTVPSRFANLITHIGGLTESGALVHPMHVGIDRAAKPMAAATASAAAVIQPPLADFLDSPHCSVYWGDHKATITPQPVPFAASMPYLNCGYTPQQMALAYGGNKSATTGKGVTVAIVDAYASPTIKVDANRYFKNHGLPPLNGKNFSQVVPDGIYHVSPAETCGPQGWFTEESLDVESVHTFAPGANIVYVGARNCDDPLFDAVYDTVDNGLADIITNSWGKTASSHRPTNKRSTMPNSNRQRPKVSPFCFHRATMAT